MKQILILLVTIVAVLAYTELEYKQMWKEWLAKHQKLYSSPQEMTRRFQIFCDNVDRIDQLNAKYAPKTKFAMNKFGDLSKEEFKKLYTNPVSANPNWEGSLPEAPRYSEQQLRALPTSFDWRPKGAVTPVKDQGMCGSCWSFSTTGNIEGQWFLAGHSLVGLSEQNLVDCDHECMQYEGENVCDQGCDGGLMPNAYEYVIKNAGIDTEESYPYQGVDGTCNFNKNNIGATISNYTMISKDEDQMAAYLVAHGPISIAADAEEWQFYFYGVFYLPCGTTLDHGILIVGYDVETDIFGQQMPYWIVKNSWGADWGYDGYIYLERGVGRCGCNLFASSSIV